MSLRDLAMATLEVGFDNIRMLAGPTSDGYYKAYFMLEAQELYCMKARSFDSLSLMYDALEQRLEDPVLCLAMTMEDE